MQQQLFFLIVSCFLVQIFGQVQFGTISAANTASSLCARWNGTYGSQVYLATCNTADPYQTWTFEQVLNLDKYFFV